MHTDIRKYQYLVHIKFVLPPLIVFTIFESFSFSSSLKSITSSSSSTSVFSKAASFSTIRRSTASVSYTSYGVKIKRFSLTKWKRKLLRNNILIPNLDSTPYPSLNVISSSYTITLEICFTAIRLSRNIVSVPPPLLSYNVIYDCSTSFLDNHCLLIH